MAESLFRFTTLHGPALLAEGQQPTWPAFSQELEISPPRF